MSTFPVPTRAAFETDATRVGVYVLSADSGCVWIHVPGLMLPKAGERARLTFRNAGHAALGLGGIIVRGLHDTVGVQVRGPIDTAIVRAWAEGLPADVSPSQRIFRSETPTADHGRIADVRTQLTKPPRRRLHDTVEDMVLRLHPA